MPGVILAKKIRESRGLNAWEMHKRMGKKTVQAYLSLERKAKRVTTRDFLSLWEISELSAEDFLSLAVKCAKKE